MNRLKHGAVEFSTLTRHISMDYPVMEDRALRSTTTSGLKQTGLFGDLFFRGNIVKAKTTKSLRCAGIDPSNKIAS